MTITYKQVYHPGLRREVTKAKHKGVSMDLELGEDLVFIHWMESANKNKGECQETIVLLRENFKGKRLCSSPPMNDESQHILDKMGVEYKEFMK